MAERSESGHGGLPAKSVLVASGFRPGHHREGIDGRLGDLREFSGCPAGHLQDGVVGILQAGQQESGQHRGALCGVAPPGFGLVGSGGVRPTGLVVGRACAGLVRTRQGLQGPSPDGGFRVGQAGRQLVGRESVDST